jgi:hypothetical protein
MNTRSILVGRSVGCFSNEVIVGAMKLRFHQWYNLQISSGALQILVIKGTTDEALFHI